MLSGLKGFSQLAINSLSPVAHKSMNLALDHRKSLRSKASINIAESDLRTSLIEEDPWSMSLYPSDSTKVILESKKVPALRSINIKPTPRKLTGQQKPMNKAMAGRLLKAKQAASSQRALNSYNCRQFQELPYKRNIYNPPRYNPASQGQRPNSSAPSQGIIRAREAPAIPNSVQPVSSDKEEAPPSKLFRGSRGRGRGSYRGNQGGSRQ